MITRLIPIVNCFIFVRGIQNTFLGAKTLLKSYFSTQTHHFIPRAASRSGESLVVFASLVPSIVRAYSDILILIGVPLLVKVHISRLCWGP
jgi:hypothetical protein